jgi:hypothetical protein
MEDNNTNDKKHYVCKACGGVSPNPKNCETAGCALNGKPLTECRCEDNLHGKSPDAQSAPEKK